jgi:hypothetical protein
VYTHKNAASETPTTSRTPSVPTTTEQAPAPSSVPAPAAPARSVHVELSSDPSGAEVYEGAVSLGHTPLRMDWSGEQGDPSRSHTFTFRMPQRQDATVTLSGASLIHTATLAAAPASTSPATTPASNTPTTPRPQANGHPGPRPGPRPSRPPGGQHPPGYRDIDDW